MFRAINNHLLNYSWLCKYSACKFTLPYANPLTDGFPFMNICSAYPLHLFVVNISSSKKLPTIRTYQLMTIRVSFCIIYCTFFNTTLLPIVGNKLLRMFPILRRYNRFMTFSYIKLCYLAVIFHRIAHVFRGIIFL